MVTHSNGEDRSTQHQKSLLIKDKGKQNYDLCTFTTPETSDGRKNAMKSNVLVLV